VAADVAAAATPAAADVEVVRLLEQDLTALLDRVDASTVSLLGCEAARAGQATVTGAGSGVVVSHRGTFIVTNAHVVEGCARIEAILPDGTRVRVRVRATEPKADLALLSFDTVPDVVLPVVLAGMSTPHTEGAWVVATGNPFLLGMDGRSVASLGVLSGQRGAECEARLSGCSLQHDAEINPGSSGGPLWSVDGELIGVNGAIVTRSRLEGTGPAYSGASFSVPVARVRAFIDQVLAGAGAREAPRRPAPTGVVAPATGARRASDVLGSRLVSVEDRAGRGLGVRIRGLETDSPLLRGPALEVGDLITAIRLRGSTHVVRSVRDLDALLGGAEAGLGIEVVVRRDGTERTWTGQVGS
jgi:serine protease Do